MFTSCVPTKDLIYLQKKDNSPIPSINIVNAKPYRLQVNDIISINIKALDPKLVEIFNTSTSQLNQTVETLYFNGYTINDHGNIRVPVLGEVSILGFTIEEVREIIEKKLLQDHFKKEAGIFVSVKLAGFRYTVNGEIVTPGTKVLYQEKVSILEAIANSGDITVTGNRKDVKVIRQYPQGTETFSLDLTDSRVMQLPGYYLQPNDYVYIKPLKQKSWGTGKTGIESIGTAVTILTLVATTFLILRN